MKTVFLSIIIIHAAIHLFGFLKAFGFFELQQLSASISKQAGIWWLVVSALMLIYLFAEITDYSYSWILGAAAIVSSQLLIILFWSDAKFGTIANLIIVIGLLQSYGKQTFQSQLDSERNEIISLVPTTMDNSLQPKDIADLPVAVRNWLSSTGALGKPVIQIGYMRQEAKMQMSPAQEDWYEAHAVQYTITDTPGFLWMVNLEMNPFFKLAGRDSFIYGKGEMLIKANSLIKVVDEEGAKLDEGTAQRYLGELVWFPTAAVSQYIAWEAVNDTTAVASLNYAGTTGRGTFYFNQEGDFIKFSAMRYKDNDANAKRYEWVISVDEYDQFEGIRVPSRMRATWKLDEGDWTWLILKVTELKFNKHVMKGTHHN